MAAPLFTLEADPNTRAFALLDVPTQSHDQRFDIRKDDGAAGWTSKDCFQRFLVILLHSGMLANGASNCKLSRFVQGTLQGVSCNPLRLRRSRITRKIENAKIQKIGGRKSGADCDFAEIESGLREAARVCGLAAPRAIARDEKGG